MFCFLLLFFHRQNASQFADKEQHDAQEMLHFLLSASSSAVPTTAQPGAKRKRLAITTQQLLKFPKVDFKTVDSVTLCRRNVNNCHDPENEPNFPSILKLFEGRLAFQTRCFDCDNLTSRSEEFLHVSVPVTCHGPTGFPALFAPSQSGGSSASPVSLSWCLSQFASRERLTGRDKYWCDLCGHLAEAERSILFSVLPPTLIVHLNRFTTQTWGRTVGKVAGNIAVPLSLSLKPWCTHNCQRRTSMYLLRAVVLHCGASCHSGHYTAAVQAGEGRWLYCDDETVREMPSTALRDLLSPLSVSAASPYILFYSVCE